MELLNTEARKMIVFQLGEEEYAVPVETVGSIERVIQITRVPKAPSYVKGVINLLGVITPIIDLRARFGMEEIAYNDLTRIIIVHYEELEVGVIVDAAKDVIDIYDHMIEPAPEVIGTLEADYIEGVVKIDNRLLVLLELEKALIGKFEREPI